MIEEEDFISCSLPVKISQNHLRKSNDSRCGLTEGFLHRNIIFYFELAPSPKALNAIGDYVGSESIKKTADNRFTVPSDAPMFTVGIRSILLKILIYMQTAH